MTEPATETALEALREVIDPEVGINIVDLGLVYDVAGEPGGAVHITMTMTSPACPLGAHLRAECEAAVNRALPGTPVTVELVWDPPWHPDRMSETARRRLGRT